MQDLAISLNGGNQDTAVLSDSCAPEFHPRQSLTVVRIDLSPGSVTGETPGEDSGQRTSFTSKCRMCLMLPQNPAASAEWM